MDAQIVSIPVARRRTVGELPRDIQGLAAELRRSVDGEVRFAPRGPRPCH